MTAKPFTATAADCEIVFTLEPDKQKLVVGEPVFVSLAMKPNCDKKLSVIDGGDYRNRYGRADSFKFSSTPAVAVRDVGPGFGGMMGPQKLPWTKRMLLAHWFDFQKPGVYTITVEKDLAIGTGNMDAIEKMPTVHIAPTMTIEVLPASRDVLGNVIDELGADIDGTDYDKQQEAMTRLGMVDDDRVVPIFARVIDGKKSTLQMQAVWGVGKFSSDAALDALLRALANPDLRLAAAQMIGENKNPKAWDALWALRNDKESNIRLTVLHALAKQKTPDVPKRLADFEKDPDPMIANEAKRYIRERH